MDTAMTEYDSTRIGFAAADALPAPSTAAGAADGEGLP